MKKNILIIGFAIVVWVYAGRYLERMVVVGSQLRNFSSDEFGVWWPMMNADLLQKLDNWTTELKKQIPGVKVAISSNAAALGRVVKDDNESGWGSYHNVVKHGSVRAVDIKPYVEIAGGIRPLTKQEFLLAEQLAIDFCFGGIGIYPQWQRPGFHLDNRERDCKNPARWGGTLINGSQKIVSREIALRGFA